MHLLNKSLKPDQIPYYERFSISTPLKETPNITTGNSLRAPTVNHVVYNITIDIKWLQKGPQNDTIRGNCKLSCQGPTKYYSSLLFS